MTYLRLLPTLAAVLCLATGAASAQSATVPEKTAPGTAPATNLDGKGGTLSDKLGDTGGVIKPTGDVDPAMHKAAPQTGSMPVVKPGQVEPQSGNGTKTDKGGLQ